MKQRRIGWAAWCSVCVSLSAQELLWEVNSPASLYSVSAPSYGDLDRDGTDDFLTTYLRNPFTLQETTLLRIQSGANGTVLDERLPPAAGIKELRGVGDFDGDGFPDYVVTGDTGGVGLNHVQVWSPHRDVELLRITGSRSPIFGGSVAGDVDLDGDGQPDLVVASLHQTASDVKAYSHTGTLLYTIPATTVNRLVLEVVGLDDLDGDGCNEFLIGGTDYNLGFTRGFLAVISGRTGAALRTTFDQQQGDIIGWPITAAGDMDGDGVQDYATGNWFGGVSTGRKQVTVYSGASGAIIRQWLASNYDLGSMLLAGRDVDLDGRPDVIAASTLFVNSATGHAGRAQVFSSRDQQLLMHTEPAAAGYLEYGLILSDLGLHQGYPVFAISHRPFTTPTHLQVWRCSPPGTGIVGPACSNTGTRPTAGIRRVDTPQGEGCRIVLGSAPPGAFAWCLAAPACANTFGGSTLPLPLDSLGFQGCVLGVPPFLTETLRVGTAGWDCGYTAIDLPLQLDPAGFHAAVQWLVLDFTALAYAATPRLEFKVQ